MWLTWRNTVVTSVTSVVAKTQFSLVYLVCSSVMEEGKHHRGIPNCDSGSTVDSVRSFLVTGDTRPNHTELSFGDHANYISYHSNSPKVSPNKIYFCNSVKNGIIVDDSYIKAENIAIQAFLPHTRFVKIDKTIKMLKELKFIRM